MESWRTLASKPRNVTLSLSSKPRPLRVLYDKRRHSHYVQSTKFRRAYFPQGTTRREAVSSAARSGKLVKPAAAYLWPDTVRSREQKKTRYRDPIVVSPTSQIYWQRLANDAGFRRRLAESKARAEAHQWENESRRYKDMQARWKTATPEERKAMDMDMNQFPMLQRFGPSSVGTQSLLGSVIVPPALRAPPRAPASVLADPAQQVWWDYAGNGRDVSGAGANALWNNELDKALAGWPQYHGAITMDKVDDVPLSIPAAFIVNTLESNAPKSKTGHWIAVNQTADSLEVFDPLGEKMPKALDEALGRRVVAQKLPHMQKIKESSVQCQADDSSVCGHWCAMFLLKRFNGVPYDRATGFCSKDKAANDEQVEGEFRQAFGFV